MSQTHPNCPLCESAGGQLVFEHPKFRVIWADEPLYPGFLRLIWTEHVREFSQLSENDQMLCMRAVVLLERFVLEQMKADKSNVATLGNVVPHLHWHVIPRFEGDPHFPAPVWAAAPSGAAPCAEQDLIKLSQNDLTHRLNELLFNEFH